MSVTHLSIRVPWHEAGWDGTVCQHPTDNASCLVLQRVHEERDDAQEMKLAGRHVADLPQQGYRPPCIAERMSFMSSLPIVRYAEHPYTAWSAAHAAFRPTRVEIPAYAAQAVPFRWLLRSETERLCDEDGVDYRTDLEDAADALMGSDRTAWVQDAENHRAIFENFFRDVHPGESLVFFYAKRIPLTDKGGRVLIGAGTVTGLTPAQEYDYAGATDLRAMYWETAVHHGIRPGAGTGVLMPYQALLKMAEIDPDLDLEAGVAFAPDHDPVAFSYATERVPTDMALESLLELDRALQALEKLLQRELSAERSWVDGQVNRLWTLRGPCPGLGSVLSAFGLERGTLIARALSAYIPDGSDPWATVDAMFADPSSYGDVISKEITPSFRDKWQKLGTGRKEALQLLTRIALSTASAIRFWRDPETRAERGDPTDDELLDNPYLLAERGRHVSPEERVPVLVVDRGVYPEEPIASAHPLPTRSGMVDALDTRRVRALIVDRLEAAASEEGHTLLPAPRLLERLAELPLAPACPLDSDRLAQLPFEEGSSPVFRVAAGAGDGYQLDTYVRTREVIKKAVTRRRKGARHNSDVDYAARLAGALPSLPSDGKELVAEERARVEKVAALRELFESRISVLVGPAGTGKTTLLRVLCRIPSVHSGGILLLAPTGKARVRLQTAVGEGLDAQPDAQTIAQFLVQRGRYVPATGQYRVTGDVATRYAGARTVVIDESSMLTEDQLASTLDALGPVDRLVLVGDPRQLPPIGAGRPYVDIVRELTGEGADDSFPRVRPGHAELTVLRRQHGELRDDLALASWFGGEDPTPGADEVWDRLRAGSDLGTLSAVRWERSDFGARLTEVLVSELGLEGPDDHVGFAESYGGSEYQGNVYFHVGRSGRAGAGSKVEEWQILSPVRARAWGTVEINRALQRRFRGKAREAASVKPDYRRKVPRPFGPEEIVYGDKVINLVNGDRKVWPNTGLGYVANGEIGVVVGQFKGAKAKYMGAPWALEVEFSSQTHHAYSYVRRDGGEDDAVLELAYAVTVHKCQGSEFRKTVLVLPAKTRGLTRELLYTALTRQRDRVVILHEGDLGSLRELSSPARSATASRLTNLFADPVPVLVQGRFMEDGLLHRTRADVLVRSKNEVIIADLLESLGLTWSYESPWKGDDGSIRYPDFTIEDAESGRIVLWEHLGLLDDPTYAQKWAAKKAWYAANGVTEDPSVAERALLFVTDDLSGADSKAWESGIRELLDL